ncbi:hypothetical protein HKD37_04G010456 [Glycine soja]
MRRIFIGLHPADVCRFTMHRAIRIFESSPKASALALTLSTLFVKRKDIDLIDEEEAQISGDRASATSNKAEIYNEEARKKTQKHKPKRVESVNADAEAFAEAVEHMNKRDTDHQNLALDNKTGDSTMLKMGDSAKVVIKQDMKGREHKYGFNNNEREKPEKKRVVDDETGDKHELDEVLRRQIETKNRCLNKRKM